MRERERVGAIKTGKVFFQRKRPTAPRRETLREGIQRGTCHGRLRAVPGEAKRTACRRHGRPRGDYLRMSNRRNRSRYICGFVTFR